MVALLQKMASQAHYKLNSKDKLSHESVQKYLKVIAEKKEFPNMSHIVRA